MVLRASIGDCVVSGTISPLLKSLLLLEKGW